MTSKATELDKIDSSLVVQCLASRGDDFLALHRQLEHSGHFFQPVRLRGSLRQVDRSTGKSSLRYSTAGEPYGVLLKACGNRRQTRCPPCATTYQADARHLVRAGLTGGKGVPESVAEHPSVFVTLTAPSFGTVHHALADGVRRPCHPASPNARCRHGRPLGCWSRHEAGDPDLGQPLCPSCYDYEGAVVWNSLVTELWRRTTIYARRALARILGLTASELASTLRLSYAKVVEYQRRGVVHLHVVVRLDGLSSDEQLVRPPAHVDATILARAVLEAAHRVAVPYPVRRPARPLKARWGDQIDVTAVGDHGPRCSAPAVASYVAKYATKSTDDGGVLDRPVRPGGLDSSQLPEHLRRMVETALRLAAKPELQDLRLDAWAHTLGFRGHWLTKSKLYSTTLTALRAARADWRRREGNEDLDPLRSAPTGPMSARATGAEPMWRSPPLLLSADKKSDALRGRRSEQCLPHHGVPHELQGRTEVVAPPPPRHRCRR